MSTDQPQPEGPTPTTLGDWSRLDSPMASALLSEITYEMHQQIQKEKGEILFKLRPNQNAMAVPTAILAMHLRRVEELCERVYEMYQDVWLRQGNSITPGILRAICEHGIGTTIAGRKNSVIYEWSEEAQRSGMNQESVKAATAEFSRALQRLLAKWRLRVGVEAKTLENLAARPPVVDNPAAQYAERDLNQANERIRHFEAEIANTESKIAAFQQSLSTLIVQGGPALQIKGIEAALRRLNQQKADLVFRRDDWRLAQQSASRRLEEMRQRSSHSQPTTDPLKKAAKSMCQPGSGSEYRSDIKMAVRRVLTKKPHASAQEICHYLDGSEIDLPTNWQAKGNRLFSIAYKDRQLRSRISKLISKVRADLREARKR